MTRRGLVSPPPGGTVAADPAPATSEERSPVRAGAGVGTYRSVLGRAAFRDVAVPYALSAVAQSFGLVAVTVVVFEQTGSATWVAAVAAARLLPYVLLSSLAGVLADRHPLRSVMAASALARLLTSVGLVAAVLAGGSPVVVTGLVFVLTAFGTPCYPATMAATTTRVPKEDLVPANGALTALETVAFAAGPAAGGALLVLLEPTAVLALNVALFAAALGSCLLISPVHRRTAILDAPCDTRGWAALVDGVRAVITTPGVAMVVVLVTAVNLVYGCVIVALVLVATDTLALGADGVGLLTGAFGAGAVLGVLGANVVARHGSVVGTLLSATLLACVPVSLLGMVGATPVAAGLLVLVGAAGVVAEIIGVARIQAVLPTTHVGRVIGLLDATLVGAILVGSLATPPLVDGVGLGATLALVGLVVPAGALVVVRWIRPAPQPSRAPLVVA